MKARLFSYFLLFPFLLLNCQQQKVTQKISSQLPQKGMVSSAHPLATEAGLQILAKGGNAFDAAVAIAASLNVVEPMMSGMGGYGTILIYDAKKKKIRFLDSSGKIPLNMNADMMRLPNPDYLENRKGAKSISTPGNVNAWDAMSREYGKLKWEELFQPAIKFAREGFDISERLAVFLSYSFEEFSDYTQSFYGTEGKALQAGDLLVQKDLALSLERLSKEGRTLFYEGELAQKIAQSMEERGSFLSLEDLQKDKAEWWEPIRINYKGYEVYTASPPANSFPGLIRLGMMSKLDDSIFQHNQADYLHYFAEITKHAFWCRLRYAGDPEISAPPLERLLSEAYWESELQKINVQKAKDFKAPGVEELVGKNTTHFVVVDQEGNIVSATQTLGNLFGSKVMPKGTGIWMNNSLAYCTYEPKGNPMDAIPGQRKLSGDCPVIILKDGNPWAALGTPGGHTIPQTVPQMILNMIDFGMDIDEAIQAPRISFVEPNKLVLEKGIDAAVMANLKTRGHNIQEAGRLGNAHGVSFHYDSKGKFIGYKGAADKRGEGEAAGY